MREKETMFIENRKQAGETRRSRTVLAGLAMVGTLALSACDLGVVNPEIIEEDDLMTPAAIPAIVNGARHTFGMATTIQGAGGVYSVSAILADELTHVGSWVPPREISDGLPGNASPENQSHWGYTSRARWQAEDAIEKVAALVDNPDSNEWMATAVLYAGLASRVQGDMFCEAVIDGGELLPHSAFHERAEAHLTRAIQVAEAAGRADLRDAAYAGRAQTRMMLGNWAGAVADAGQVSTNFVYAQPHSDNSGGEGNGVFEWSALASGPYSVWGTPFAEWGLDLSAAQTSEGDARVKYRSLAATTDGQPAVLTGGDNRRPYWFAQKYTSRNDAIAIAKGTDLRLIEAEARLRENDLAGALASINEVRTFHGLANATAADLDEGWQLLMKERGVELWLEGRRLPDLRRWASSPDTRARITTEAVRGVASGQPAASDPRVNVLEASPFCLRISTNEIFSNPNLAGKKVS
jgi:hypothetical protein